MVIACLNGYCLVNFCQLDLPMDQVTMEGFGVKGYPEFRF